MYVCVYVTHISHIHIYIYNKYILFIMDLFTDVKRVNGNTQYIVP